MAAPSPHHHRHHRRHHHHHHPVHAPAKAAHAVVHAVAPPTVPTPWWDQMTDPERIITMIHAGLSSSWTREIMPHHVMPSLAVQAGVKASPVAVTGQQVGYISMKYETGFLKGQEAAAAAVVSTPANDPGGKSYGAFQLNSTGGMVKRFLANEGAQWASGFAGADPTVAGAFGTEWTRIAALSPMPFFEAQRAYIERTHYAPVVAGVLLTTKVDIDKCEYGVREAVFSMSVQHGKAMKLVIKSVEALSGLGSAGEREYDILLINKLYDVRGEYVVKLKLSYLLDRYKRERKDALALIG